MILYHGSNTNIKEIDLSMCRPFRDFGRGFYLTELKEQAEKMAERIAGIYGGTPVLNTYEFNEEAFKNAGLNIKNFGVQTSKEWANFVKNNRNKNYEDYSSLECNLDNKYDIVIGPVADDKMAVLFRQYENRMISFDYMLKEMTYKKTSNQYSFHTERAIALLRKVGD